MPSKSFCRLSNWPLLLRLFVESKKLGKEGLENDMILFSRKRIWRDTKIDSVWKLHFWNLIQLNSSVPCGFHTNPF